MIETEIKIRVDDLAGVRERLESLGAEHVGRYLESNWILDRPDSSLRRAGCGLRLRSTEVLEGRRQGPTVTYKGPVLRGAYKQREELELVVDDAERALAVLARLGFETRISYRKRRDRWRVGDCRVELDEVPMLGTFVEVEGPSEPAVADAVQRIGLDAGAQVREGYPRMLWYRCRQTGHSPVDIGFD